MRGGLGHVAAVAGRADAPALAGERHHERLERIYWDQASVLVQIGVLDRGSLPVTGVEQARKFENPQLPSNALFRS
jgi:hypothetical protein